jgi:hypothetical protein
VAGSQAFGIAEAWRATTADSTEEVIILTEQELDRIDLKSLTMALIQVLPHTKVMVVKQHPLWRSEPL